MKLRATAPTAQLDYSTGDVVLSFRIPKESRLSVDEVLNLQGDLTLEVTKYRKNRSLDANAYMWVLCDKIAQAVKATKESVYREIIKRVGVFSIIAAQEDKAEAVINGWEGRGIGWVAETMDGCKINGCVRIMLYYGSSTYNTDEFSRLLDEIISDAKDLGIETATPDEIALMKARWNDEKQKDKGA